MIKLSRVCAVCQNSLFEWSVWASACDYWPVLGSCAGFALKHGVINFGVFVSLLFSRIFAEINLFFRGCFDR